MPLDLSRLVNGNTVDADELKAVFLALQTLVEAVPAGPPGPPGTPGAPGAVLTFDMTQQNETVPVPVDPPVSVVLWNHCGSSTNPTLQFPTAGTVMLPGINYDSTVLVSVCNGQARMTPLS